VNGGQAQTDAASKLASRVSCHLPSAALRRIDKVWRQQRAQPLCERLASVHRRLSRHHEHHVLCHQLEDRVDVAFAGGPQPGLDQIPYRLLVVRFVRFVHHRGCSVVPALC
jgi:hypothetical protein